LTFASLQQGWPRSSRRLQPYPNIPIPTTTPGILTWWTQDNGQVAFSSYDIERFVRSKLSGRRAN